ncbi:hypothetical protein NO263_03410 [Gluconacetobacter entanii]|uniref:DUF4760 domain-containing protein n=1 Tax=Gluconacetobacter entanii TaxID=108528 RepID=A0ABT3K2J6_9PROT|nr:MULTISPECIES: hypothetical protein [Acetobacteraceae]MCW4589623.1 hypothetical protein [Gluconacetobacter entanii]MCW4592925.1 hypothetical protein [Gluconacetobacter entanii]NPC89171.1 hypothetical protein [Gluconacetobacter entanii]
MDWTVTGPSGSAPLHVHAISHENWFMWVIHNFAPLIAVLFTGGIAIWVASRARAIATEQKEIAREKYILDLFDKRIEIFDNICSMVSDISVMEDDKDIEEFITSDSVKNTGILIIKSEFYFNKDVKREFGIIYNKCRDYYNKFYQSKKEKSFVFSEQEKDKFRKEMAIVLNTKLPMIFRPYAPDVARFHNREKKTKTFWSFNLLKFRKYIVTISFRDAGIPQCEAEAGADRRQPSKGPGSGGAVADGSSQRPG